MLPSGRGRNNHAKIVDKNERSGGCAQNQSEISDANTSQIKNPPAGFREGFQLFG